MNDLAPFMRVVEAGDADLIAHWAWLVPSNHTPALISVLGDWVVVDREGNHWALSSLEGTYELIACSSLEFNAKKREFTWLDEVFCASWQEIAQRHGHVPDIGQCISWRVLPVIGGEFHPSNLCVVSEAVHQCVTSQVHKQLTGVG